MKWMDCGSFVVCCSSSSVRRRHRFEVVEDGARLCFNGVTVLVDVDDVGRHDAAALIIVVVLRRWKGE